MSELLILIRFSFQSRLPPSQDDGHEKGQVVISGTANKTERRVERMHG